MFSDGRQMIHFLKEWKSDAKLTAHIYYVWGMEYAWGGGAKRYWANELA